MPLLVSEIWPSRNALLLLGSSHDSVPGTKRPVHLLRVLERLDRLGTVDHDLVVLVDQLAAERPDQPLAPGIAVAGRIAERESGRRALRLQRLAELEEAVGVLREAVESGGLDVAFAVHHAHAGHAQRDADPFLAVRAEIRVADRVPAAVLLAEVGAHVGDVDQLLGIQVGVVVGRQDDVGAGAGVGGHRRLRAHVLPALGVDADLDAVLVAELLDVGHVLVLVALDEALPAQDPQLGALLRRVAPLRVRVLDPEQRPGRGAGGNCRGRFQEPATFEFTHDYLLGLWARRWLEGPFECQATRRLPLAASNSCARVRSGAS